MLELINEARVDKGLAPVVLGDNPAPQLHVESALENCFSSHWGIDGLKPYMRYSLNGGYQSNAENTSGGGYCIEESDGYSPIVSIKQDIRDAVAGWMDNPDHRSNILYPWYKKVSIGLAWDRYNFKAVQQFEGDYVEYDQRPAIGHGALAVVGTAKNGVRFEKDHDLTRPDLLRSATSRSHQGTARKDLLRQRRGQHSLSQAVGEWRCRGRVHDLVQTLPQPL